MGTSPGEITLLLSELKRGSKEAEAELVPLVYNELRRIAAYYMRDERAGHTLQPTALVNEAYLRLVDQSRADWKNRAQFFGVAAQLMRRVLVDHARERTAQKRGGRRVRIEVGDFAMESVSESPEEVLAIDEALSRLTTFDAQQAQVVEMRCFGGLTVGETAEALGISTRTVKRDWAMATAWLRAELAGR
jgi:RNA polymerase sigma-70 factor (ECF subfamily)